MNDLKNLYECLAGELNEVQVDKAVAGGAMQSLNRMLDFAKEHGVQSQGRRF